MLLVYSEAYSEPSQKYKMELFAKINKGYKLLTIFAKSAILDVWLGSKWTSVIAEQDVKDFIKPFEAPQRSVKIKFNLTFSLRPGSGQEGLQI